MPFPAIPGFAREVSELLGAVWPRVPAAIERACARGADWAEVSTPFVSRASSGELAGHVGVLELRLWVEGRALRVAGVHGVCVHPQQRGRGHYLRAMEQALAFVDRHYDAALLWTAEPALYRRFGFELWEERILALERRARPGVPEGRALDLELPEDRALLRRAFESKAAPSQRLAAGDDGRIFLIDLALWPPPGLELVWVESLESVVAVERLADTLRLHDLLAPRVPDLEELIARVAPSATRCEAHLSVDRWLEAGARLEAHPSEDVRMLRGRNPCSAGSWCLPSLTRC